MKLDNTNILSKSPLNAFWILCVFYDFFLMDLKFSKLLESALSCVTS